MEYHFIWDIIACGEVTMRKIVTHDNPVDMLSKFLPIEKFKHCVDLIGIRQGD